MSIDKLTSKYISSAEHAFGNMKRVQSSLTVKAEEIDAVIDSAFAYLEDAKYYKTQKKFETSLTSIAYCEGLLDALRLLGVVKFEW